MTKTAHKDFMSYLAGAVHKDVVSGWSSEDEDQLLNDA